MTTYHYFRIIEEFPTKIDGESDLEKCHENFMMNQVK